MSCPGIPLNVPVVQPCQNYVCQNNDTSPPTFGCVAPVFVYARHYVRHGTVLPGLAVAYLPAVTACQLQVVTVPIKSLRTNPDAPYYGL